MNTPAPAPVPQRPSYAERSFLHTQTAAITVPLMQTAVISVMIAFAILVLSWLFGWRHGWKVAVAALAIMPIVTWIFLQRRWLLLTAETIFQTDFSGDGVVGTAPSRERKFVTVQINKVTEKGHVNVSAIRTLPADDEQLQALVNGIRRGRPISQGEWSGKGKPFSRNEWDTLVAVMELNLYVALKNPKYPRLGYELLEAGQAFVDQYPTSPTPPVDGA